MRKFKDIIDRIEYLRDYLGLNKSRFSGEIGMKPQTYNNFIGAQGSKPNIELITGIVNKFGVNPMWLLNGSGSMFLSQEERGGAFQYAPAMFGAVREGKAEARGVTPERAEQVRAEIETVEPLLEQVEGHIKSVEQQQLPAISRILALLKRYYDADPLAAVQELRETLRRIEKRTARRAADGGSKPS